MKNLRITPVSVIKRSGFQRVDVSAETLRPAHYKLYLYDKEQLIAESEFALAGGRGNAAVWLKLPKYSFNAKWVIMTLDGEKAAEYISDFKPAREWTIYVMVSSHTDIGLHNSQYIQRSSSSVFIDIASELCSETEGLPEESRYRYMMEGTWFWSNYLADRPEESSQRIINEYIKKGKIGVCAGTAGNHTQTYGFEELCRSAYNKMWLAEQGIESRTMTMIDNNGISWSLIQPYANAGYENIIFAPNQWNPLPSAVWKCDYTVEGFTWNPEAGGGGSRVDVRYGSELPMLFWWEGKFGQKLLVWASTQYGFGGCCFGIKVSGADIRYMEDKMAAQLTEMEERYPYDIWLIENYNDDQKPGLAFQKNIQAWNEVYEYPRLKMLGNADEPFDIVRRRYGDVIPTLRGDITGGWYQHPLSAANLLSEKLEADRKLANAEKYASIASMYNSGYRYPADEFSRAWAALIMNDEHSYGTSGYQGRRVYETWMGHRDWIEKAGNTAERETENALAALSEKIGGKGRRVLVFNPSAFERSEIIKAGGECIAELPPFGYSVIPYERFCMCNARHVQCAEPPAAENSYYKLQFAENGSISEIYDKQLNRTINIGCCNEMMYTEDNHKSFNVPKKAEFSVAYGMYKIVVEIHTKEAVSGADIVTTVTLPSNEKRIDIENRLYHVRGMINKNRYYRYLYYAFPFDVENPIRICELGGSEAQYCTDITGHGTDVYMAAHEYCCADSGDGRYGVGLIQLDSQLIEFDRIHSDKTDYADAGRGSAMYSYVANDWLQMHMSGGSALDFRLRYTITSYAGTHKEAKLACLAERIANPVMLLTLTEDIEGGLPASKSFFESDARLIGLKRAYDGNGLTARLYSESIPKEIKTCIGEYEPISINEAEGGRLEAGFTTLRIGAGKIKLEKRIAEKADELEIGGLETGLITKPRAACGEDYGMLYLLWGKCTSGKLSHYELFRGESEDFTADESTFIARAESEEFVVGRYIDTGLEDSKRYYYRVRAVSAEGAAGKLSDVFSALTKERYSQQVNI